ncbi:MAG: hypothetical protein K0Q50_2450 [Vampirovibrio sp.]|jgi:hypothetical protein|nr:hypothetical protein [Vampirovibrio sp.]
MISTDVNPFGNAVVQPWLTSAATEPGRSILQNNSVFILPGAYQANAQPQSGLRLFADEGGFGNFLNFLVGSKASSYVPAGNKSNNSPRIESSFSWEDAIDPETGQPRAFSQTNRVVGIFESGQDNPFYHTLDLVS